MSEARSEIMARIREALKVPSPMPHLKAESKNVTGKTWLPEVGETKIALIGLLSENLAKLKANFHQVKTLDEAKILVRELAREKNWKKIAYHSNDLVTPVAQAIEGESWSVDDSFSKDQLEVSDVGITSCVSIVAQFGAILVSSESSGGRGLSILPPVHIVLAKVDQVVPDLAACLEQIQPQSGGKLPSMLSFITGPSRTGDIERILVLGAHGPKELYLILIG